jgi:NADP-reducing hydrogenase subunit HndB
MPSIKSLEDLKRVRDEALQKRQLKAQPGHIQITVGMGTPGIAAGARETMKAILEYIEKENLSQIQVRQTGNIGFDSMEPIVQVMVGEDAPVTYGKVTPDAARRILAEHIVGGQPVKDYILQV